MSNELDQEIIEEAKMFADSGMSKSELRKYLSNTNADLLCDERMLNQVIEFAFKEDSETSFLSLDDITDILQTFKSKLHNSRYKSISSFNGLRKGHVTSIMGYTGHGKTTYFYTLLIDIATSCKVLLYTTEETKKQAELKLNILAQKLLNIELAQKAISNIFILSDNDINLASTEKQTLECEFARIREELIKQKCFYFLFDNISTSFFSDFTPNMQKYAAKSIREIATDDNIGVLYLIHPKKGSGILTREIELDDVRGNVSFANMAEYTLILQTFYNIQPPKSFIKVAKARHHSKAQNRYYELNFEQYNEEFGFYTSDKEVSRAYFLECLDINKNN